MTTDNPKIHGKSAKNILIISPFFPPDNSPQSIQSFRLAKALLYYGHNVAVACCSPNPEVQNNSHGIDNYSFNYKGFEIFRCEQKSHFTKFYLLEKIYRFARPHDPVVQMAAISKSVEKAIKSAYYDVVISIAEPLVSHAILLRFEKQFRRAQRIAWFSDPPPTQKSMLKLKWRRRSIKSLLNSVCRASDLIVSVTDEILLSINDLSEIQDKSIVIPHAYDPDDWTNGCQKKFKSSGNTITVLHSGALYWLRKPQTLVEAVKLITQHRHDIEIQLKFQGSLSLDVRKYIAGQHDVNKVILGKASLVASLKEMSDSDILCIIDVDIDQNIHLPSKIADYVAARKPILYIGNNDSPTCRILQQLHPAFAFGKQAPEVAKGLDWLLNRMSEVQDSEFDEICEIFCLKSCYAELQKRIIGNIHDK